MRYRKFSLQEEHRHDEETYSKKSGFEEIIFDRPKPLVVQQENNVPKFILLSQLIAMNFKWLELLQNLVAIT